MLDVIKVRGSQDSAARCSLQYRTENTNRSLRRRGQPLQGTSTTAPRVHSSSTLR
jgi:hypothetical protein